jgi:O-acetyl-ADP-ribose deacetylase (regulator of RNase III)/uncharacterized protein YwgA
VIKRVVQGNLLNSRAQTLVNTVNTVGVMGKGIALEFKRSFPEMFSDYEERCRNRRVRIGEPYIFKRTATPWIINFPTKEHWRAVSRLADIEAGLRYLAAHVQEWGVESLAVPPLGCGNGQLEWTVVGPTIRRYLDELPIPVELYAPLEVPPEQATLEFLAEASQPAGGAPPRVRPEWLTIVEVVDRISRKPYAWPVGRLRLQKIAYFLTALGVPTELVYARESYGPFAPGLKQVISRMTNNGVLSEANQGRMLRVTAGATWLDAQVAYESALSKYEPAIERVTDLMARLDDTRSEVVATVHFATKELSVQRKGIPSEADVLGEVMEWKVRRRPPLAEAEVAEAIRDLAMLGWIDVTASVGLPIDDDVLVVS